MRIISRRPLCDFGKRFPPAKVALDAWWAEARRAEWKTPTDIKARYPKASILKGGRVVFDICGNTYRLIVQFDYRKGIGVVRFVGTHDAYDKIDAQTV